MTISNPRCNYFSKPKRTRPGLGRTFRTWRYLTKESFLQSFAVSVASDTSEMRRLGWWVREISHCLALPDDITFRLDLCLEEAVHNIISYGYSDQGSHQIDVKISYDADSLALEVEDDGIAFDPLSVPVLVRPSTLAEAKIGGWGVHLIRQFSDHCRYERRGEKNRLKLLFRVPLPEM